MRWVLVGHDTWNRLLLQVILIWQKICPGGFIINEWGRIFLLYQVPQINTERRWGKWVSFLGCSAQVITKASLVSDKRTATQSTNEEISTSIPAVVGMFIARTTSIRRPESTANTAAVRTRRTVRTKSRNRVGHNFVPPLFFYYLFYRASIIFFNVLKASSSVMLYVRWPSNRSMSQAKSIISEVFLFWFKSSKRIAEQIKYAVSRTVLCALVFHANRSLQ